MRLASRRRRMGGLFAVALLGMLAGVVAQATAAAPPRVSLSTRFVPDVLGRSTTIHYGFTVSEPLPLRSLELRLPAGMGYAASELGLEDCEVSLLAEEGPEGCPPDSLLGFGVALGEVLAETTVKERSAVTPVLGPSSGGPMNVLFFVDGKWPAKQETILTGRLLLSAKRPYGSILTTQAPLVAAWPEGPDVGLLAFHSTIGPERLTYHRRQGGRTIAFRPRGLSVPNRCPPRGFPIAATFTWWGVEGSASASTRVPCPPQNRPLTPAD